MQLLAVYLFLSANEEKNPGVSGHGRYGQSANSKMHDACQSDV